MARIVDYNTEDYDCSRVVMKPRNFIIVLIVVALLSFAGGYNIRGNHEHLNPDTVFIDCD